MTKIMFVLNMLQRTLNKFLIFYYHDYVRICLFFSKAKMYLYFAKGISCQKSQNEESLQKWNNCDFSNINWNCEGLITQKFIFFIVILSQRF